MNVASIKTRDITLTGLFIAISLLLPQLFHLTGLAGPIFLPMHIGVLLCGFLLGGKFGLICGIAAPILSSLLTQMPPLAILPSMTIELAIYGLVSGFLYAKTKKIYLSLISSLILGRVAYGSFLFLTTKILTSTPSDNSVFLLVMGSVQKGIPGIIVQIILIPILVKYISTHSKANQI